MGWGCNVIPVRFSEGVGVGDGESLGGEDTEGCERGGCVVADYFAVRFSKKRPFFESLIASCVPEAPPRCAKGVYVMRVAPCDCLDSASFVALSTSLFSLGKCWMEVALERMKRKGECEIAGECQ